MCKLKLSLAFVSSRLLPFFVLLLLMVLAYNKSRGDNRRISNISSLNLIEFDALRERWKRILSKELKVKGTEKTSYLLLGNFSSEKEKNSLDDVLTYGESSKNTLGKAFVGCSLITSQEMRLDCEKLILSFQTDLDASESTGLYADPNHNSETESR